MASGQSGSFILLLHVLDDLGSANQSIKIYSILFTLTPLNGSSLMSLQFNYLQLYVYFVCIRRIISSLTLFFVYNFGNFVCGFWLLVINYWFFVLFSKCMIFYIWCLISKLHWQLLFFRFIKFSNLLQSWYFYSRLMNFSS